MSTSLRLLRAVTVLWPAFGMAALIEALVFALVDPHDLHWGHEALELDRAAVYTLAFFAFWALVSSASAITLLLAASVSRSPRA